MAKILVVDDERHVRDFVSKALRRAGHEPIEVETGHDAIRRATELRPALLLLDLKMGDAQPDGLTVFKTIRREHPDAMGVMMTAYGTEELALECWRAGMAGYLKKPFLARDVVQAVNRALEELAAHDQAASPGASRHRDRSRQAADALIERLRVMEGGDMADAEVVKELKPSLVDILTDPTGAVPVLLTCGSVLGALVQRGNAGESRRTMIESVASLRRNLERVLAIAGRPRAPEVDDALARIEAAALTGDLPTEGELARQVGRSRSQVSRGIADATGFTFLVLALGYRLGPALPALLTSREHIDQVALDAGYCDVRQFRRDVRAMFGVSARDLRRHL